MYIPKNNELQDESEIVHIINNFGFAVVVSPTLMATHLPLVYEPSSSGKGLLYGHFSKANSQWNDINGKRVLVIFNGPHAYISPAWYTVQPAVPTWNYVSVHCYGTVELLNSEETKNALDVLVKKYEPDLLKNTTVLSPDLTDKLMQGIVGFRIIIDEIQAKEKLGQQRSSADQKGVYQSLFESDSAEAKMLATYMKKRNVGTGE